MFDGEMMEEAVDIDLLSTPFETILLLDCGRFAVMDGIA